MTSARPDAPLARLTPRQREVADGIGRGLSYADTARALGLSEHTVRQYVREIVLRLDNPEDLDPYLLVFLTVRHARWLDERPATPTSSAA